MWIENFGKLESEWAESGASEIWKEAVSLKSKFITVIDLSGSKFSCLSANANNSFDGTHESEMSEIANESERKCASNTL